MTESGVQRNCRIIVSHPFRKGRGARFREMQKAWAQALPKLNVRTLAFPSTPQLSGMSLGFRPPFSRRRLAPVQSV